MGSLSKVAADWVRRLEEAAPAIPAEELYLGRAFQEARAAAAGGDFFVLSAGLGVVSASAEVPSYDLTASRDPLSGVLSRLDAATSAADWWGALTRVEGGRSGLDAAFQGGNQHSLVLCALSSVYLRMVRGDLAALKDGDLQRLRIFTGAGFTFGDARLDACVMPYDTRLDGEDSPIRGTTTDFPSRALRDFTSTVLSEAVGASAEEHVELVNARISSWRAPLRPKRATRTDGQIRDLMRTHWVEHGASASKMLRFMRDQLDLACEQSRMRRLHAEVQSQM